MAPLEAVLLASLPRISAVLAGLVFDASLLPPGTCRPENTPEFSADFYLAILLEYTRKVRCRTDLIALTRRSSRRRCRRAARGGCRCRACGPTS